MLLLVLSAAGVIVPRLRVRIEARAERTVEHEAERAVAVVPTHEHDGAAKRGLVHERAGDEQLAGQRWVHARRPSGDGHRVAACGPPAVAVV